MISDAPVGVRLHYSARFRGEAAGAPSGQGTCSRSRPWWAAARTETGKPGSRACAFKLLARPFLRSHTHMRAHTGTHARPPPKEAHGITRDQSIYTHSPWVCFLRCLAGTGYEPLRQPRGRYSGSQIIHELSTIYSSWRKKNCARKESIFLPITNTLRENARSQ